jgi:hypothetical protein
MRDEDSKAAVADLNDEGSLPATKPVNYRKLAFNSYPAVCAHCGFGIRDVLEVAHIDCNRSNNAVANLIILCPTCHKMHDLDLISTATIIEMRDRPKVVVWAKRMKDAGRKAAESRKRKVKAEKWRLAALKAVQTRARNSAARQQNGVPIHGNNTEDSTPRRTT